MRDRESTVGRVRDFRRKSTGNQSRSQYVVEIFSVLLTGVLEDRGIFVFSYPKTFTDKTPPKFKVDDLRWVNSMWWHGRRHWVLVDTFLIERKLSSRLRKLTKKDNIIILFKHMDDVRKPEETILKLINLLTKEWIYVYLKDLIQVLRCKKIDKKFWELIPKLNEEEYHRFERWKKNKKFKQDRRNFVEFDLERTEFNEQLKERFRGQQDINSNKDTRGIYSKRKLR